MTFSRRTLLMTMVGAAVTPALSCRAEPATAQTIALDVSAPRPTAKLRIGDTEPVTAIFDTGAAASVLMMSYATRLGLPNNGDASAAGPGGKAIKGFQTTISGRLGEAEFAPTLAVALDVPLPLPGVSAIISPRVFAGRLVRFDFPAGQAVVLPMGEGNEPAGAAHPYSGGDTPGAIRSVPAIGVVLPDGVTRAGNVDTGWHEGLGLPFALAETLPLDGPLKEARPMRRIGITHKAWSARLKGEVRLGDLVLTDPEVRFHEDTDELLIGMAILRTAVLTLDPGGQRVWLSQG